MHLWICELSNSTIITVVSSHALARVLCELVSSAAPNALRDSLLSEYNIARPVPLRLALGSMGMPRGIKTCLPPSHDDQVTNRTRGAREISHGAQPRRNLNHGTCKEM